MGKVFGGDSEEVTPVPIPNTEVKLFSADGTAWGTAWESRTPPDFFLKPLDFRGAFLMDIIREKYHDPLFKLGNLAAEGQFKAQRLYHMKGKI